MPLRERNQSSDADRQASNINEYLSSRDEENLCWY